MKRYSFTWWLAILPTSIIVGGPTYLVLGFQTTWGTLERIAIALAAALLVDLAIAAWMERIAPTKIRIGPGERRTIDEVTEDTAVVINGFESSSRGHVSVRGETWAAVQSPDDTGPLPRGTVVNVVDRTGLSLVVSARSR